MYNGHVIWFVMIKENVYMVIWRVDMIALVLAPSHGNNVAIFYFTHRQAAHCKCRNNNNNEEESIISKVFLKEMTNVKGQKIVLIEGNKLA